MFMIKPEDYKTYSKYESSSFLGIVGVEIKIASHQFQASEENKRLITQLTDQLIEMVQSRIYKRLPETATKLEENEKAIRSFFGERAIYLEEIPNEYSTNFYYFDRKWFRVWTDKGPIKVGMRKKVWSIEWEKRTNPSLAKNLFENEEASKDDRWIHAWSNAKAAEYINTILNRVVA